MKVSFGNILHFVNQNPQKDFTYQQNQKIDEYLAQNYPKEKPLKLITREEDRFDIQHKRVLALTGEDKDIYLGYLVENNISAINKLIQKAQTIVVS